MFFQDLQARGQGSISLVSETTEMVQREAEGSLLACQLLWVRRGVGVEDGWGLCRPRRGPVQRRGGAVGDPGGNWWCSPCRCRRPASGDGCKRPGVIGSRGPVPR